MAGENRVAFGDFPTLVGQHDLVDQFARNLRALALRPNASTGSVVELLQSKTIAVHGGTLVVMSYTTDVGHEMTGDAFSRLARYESRMA